MTKETDKVVQMDQEKTVVSEVEVEEEEVTLMV